MKNLLVLGAGLVSAPLIRYFSNRRGYRVVVLSQDLSRARAVVGDRAGVALVEGDATDESTLERYMKEADAVVSLLPATLMPLVARAAVRNRVPVVSTSYLTPDVRALDGAARDAGVLILGEVGLDPGIDHMSAVRVIRRLKSRGGTITHFISACGGLPAPDASDNPWGYKFSWSPRAVVLAARGDARYISNGEPVFIPGSELFAHRWRYAIDSHVFEMYANRDATMYIEPYDLEGVSGFFRGTLRYPGWPATMHAAALLGLFDIEQVSWRTGTTYADVLLRLLPQGSGSLVERVAQFAGVDIDSEVITRLEWAGFFSDRPIETTTASPLDLFVDRLWKIMQYRPGERDMVALKHELTVSFPDGRTEQITSALVKVGEAWGETAMAQTVSYPAAIATRLVLDGAVTATGVHLPTLGELRDPVLDELEEYGIRLVDEVRTTYPTPFNSAADYA